MTTMKLTGKKRIPKAITGVDEQNTEDSHDNTLLALENQDKAITGVDNKQSMENTHDNIQSIPNEKMIQTSM